MKIEAIINKKKGLAALTLPDGFQLVMSDGVRLRKGLYFRFPKAKWWSMFEKHLPDKSEYFTIHFTKSEINALLKGLAYLENQK